MTDMTLGLIDVSTVPVVVSARSMRQRFNGCDPDYIRDVCHGACCRRSAGGISVAVAPIEVAALVRRGAVVIDGMVQPAIGSGVCPFQHGMTHLCTIHDTGDKPFGCIASPFVLTSRDTLVVRNRYRLLKCYDDGQRIPAYRAFRASLVLLFGPRQTDVLTEALDQGSGDVVLQMSRSVHDMMDTVTHTRSASRPVGR